MIAVGLLFLICSFKSILGKEEGFIVGGDFVKSIKKFPHVAFLTLQAADSQDEFICGSSILNQLILVTAAHCFDNIATATASVGNVDREKGKVHRVASWQQHEKWDTVNINHDIALCRLQKPLTLGHTVKRVVLMKRPPKARIADLAGWGVTNEEDYSDTVMLKHTRQKLWTHAQCQRILHNSPRGTICGGESSAKGDFASSGDSGSGLLIGDNIIVGLVSYKDTSVSRSLVIYTDVPYFYDWISHTSKRLSCS
ncbi:hypodermin-B-like [Leguminivora glycinivorella]|uniref:hypodermin-B-like n=1 Tax=Leguminivora glycinivorella TaxID=1035111 RepID=UPI00200DE090|nr:hypodermin-B-like [Leguminivora glycinivorella]